MSDTLKDRPAIAVALIGARAHYAIPRMLYDAGLLSCLYTDGCGDRGRLSGLARRIPRCLQPAAVQRMLGRRIPEIPPDRIRAYSWFGVKRAICRRNATTVGALYRECLRANREFGKLVAAEKLTRSDGIYAFNAAALEVFRPMKDAGKLALLEQTAAPFVVEESTVAEERHAWPGWENADVTPQDWQPLADREAAEWELADAVLCGSSYVVESVRSLGGPVDKCHLVPYGIELASWLSQEREEHTGPLRVLFMGTVCLRKGIQYLMQAAERLVGKPVVFRAVGPVQIRQNAQAKVANRIELLGAVPREEVLRHYRWADLLVLPAVSEGSANVCYEALAAGLPVVTTPNSGSVVRDGQDGFIVPIRDPTQLAERLEQLSEDRELLKRLSRSASERGREFTWQAWKTNLLEVIRAVGCAGPNS